MSKYIWGKGTKVIFMFSVPSPIRTVLKLIKAYNVNKMSASFIFLPHTSSLGNIISYHVFTCGKDE